MGNLYIQPTAELDAPVKALQAALIPLFLIACSGGTSSSGAGSHNRVPLTAADKQAVAMLGGFGGEWLPQTQDIIRLNEPPPPGTKFAVAWQSTCRESFTIYNTTRGKSAEWLAGLFVHESQHHVDGCKTGPAWEERANAATRCWQNGVSREDCGL